jgi:hypothetical protein
VPPIFWKIPEDLLPSKCIIKPSGSSEKCHYDIKNLSNEEAADIFKDYQERSEPLNDFQICLQNGTSRKLELQDI